MPWETETAAPFRVDAIDILRGLAIAGMIAEGHHGERTLGQFRHGSWFGCTAADAVYPLFLFISGAALQLSYNSFLGRGGGYVDFHRRSVLRAAKLFALGLVLLSISNWQFRFGLGTLQGIALASLIAAPAVRFSPVQCLSLAGIIGVVHSLIINYTWAPWCGWKLRWAEGCTGAEAIDLLFLDRPRGMEGMLAAAMAGAAMIAGIYAAKKLYNGANAPLLSSGRIWIFAGAMILAARLLAADFLQPNPLWLPIVPDLFSFGYLLYCSGLALLLLLLLRKLASGSRLAAILSPLRTMGRNALALFVFIKLVNTVILKGISLPQIGADMTLKKYSIESLAAVFGPLGGSLFYSFLILAVGWLFCRVLERRSIYFRL